MNINTKLKRYLMEVLCLNLMGHEIMSTAHICWESNKKLYWNCNRNIVVKLMRQSIVIFVQAHEKIIYCWRNWTFVTNYCSKQ